MIVVVWLVEGGCGLKLDAVPRPRYLGRLPLLIGPVISSSTGQQQTALTY